MVTDKGKKQKVGEEVGEVENTELQIDGDLIISIEKLQEVQDELEKISEEASDKVLEIEQKYNEVRRPIYDKRNDIIKAIPEFWTTAFLSHPALGELVSEEDQKIFKYLSSLEVEDFKDVKSGYSISFNFNPNPFFGDSKLTKTFTFLDEGTTKVTSTSIKWKDGMGLPNGVAEDKKGNKRPHAADESFFSWFGETQKDEMDEVNDEIAEIIKEDLWPNPLTYFNNDADEMDFEGVEGVGEENGSDDEDDSDEDDEEGDDDDEGN